MRKFIENYFINLAIIVVFILILVGAGISFYNKEIMKNALQVQAQADMIKRETENTFLNIRNMDISSRGYALMQQESFLFLSVAEAKNTNYKNFRRLDSLLLVQGYRDDANYTAVKANFDTYANLYEKMVLSLRKGDIDQYKALLAEDYGKHFWTLNETFSSKLYAHQDKLNREAQAQYEAAVFRNSLVQILLLAIGLPTLAGVIYILRKVATARKALLQNLAMNNHQYFFNDGERAEEIDAIKILEGFIENLKRAAEFVNQISEGNYEAQWEQLNEQNAALNQNNLVGRLIMMREQMKKVKYEDDRRLWATEGLSNFSEVIRNHQHNLDTLTFESLKYLVKYLKAQQGNLFILEGEDEGNPYLSLAACYAFNRKKFLSRRIEPGEGLIGQTYLEGDTVYLTHIPESYTTITSGLGDANPGCIVIVPMKYNERVQAIIELASFKKFEEHEVALLEKAGEFIASAIATAQTNQKTTKLLEQMRDQTEQMRSQEEELRQNMEELEATQEEMRRKEMALEKQLGALDGHSA